MIDIRKFFSGAALVAASTLGAGIFALPYVFKEGGWVVSLFYAAAFSFFIAAAHILYWKALEKIGEKKRILGLARDYLGKAGYYFAIIGIAVGLLLTLVAYLLVGGMFLQSIFPSLGSGAILVFWVAVSIPLLLSDKKTTIIEVAGVAATSLIIIFMFLSSLPSAGFFSSTAINVGNIFLPFGAILFALAGWTSVERVYDYFRGKHVSPEKVAFSIASGTVLVALLYLLFVFGIFGSATTITSDTISGVYNWPIWKGLLLGVLGLIAVWTSHLPISLETKNAFEHDLHWSATASRILVIFLPLALVLIGFNSFLWVISLVGGVFIGLQYLLVILVGKKIVHPTGFYNLLLNLACVVFVVAAIYELYYFIINPGN